MFSFLSDSFEAATDNAGKLRSDRLVNYVWLNKKSLKGLPEVPEHLCGVPLSYLDKAYANARKYPDTQVNIWLDYDLLDAQTRYFLDAHAYLNAPSNIKFEDLRNIPAYGECKYYQPGSQTPLWSKVDLARFIVLDHCKQTMGHEKIFYADFDVEDVALDLDVTHEQMEKNGIVFGKLPKSEQITHYFRNNLSPGYIAINDRGGEYLSQRLLPDLLEISKGYRQIVLSLFLELGKEFKKGEEHLPDVLDSLVTPITMHPVGHVMPENENYRFYDLCGPTFR